MKKLFTITCISALVASCSTADVKLTKEEIAKEQILNYVTGNFHDPKSYENIEYSALQPVYGYDKEEEAKLLADSLANAINESIETALDASEEETNKIRQKYDEKRRETEKQRAELYKRGAQLLGYTMTDKCRSKNRLGAFAVNIYRYAFDTLFNIKDCERIGE